MKKNLLILILPLALSACVTTTTGSNPAQNENSASKPELTISKLERVDLRNVNTSNVSQLIGDSDLQGLGPRGSNQETFVYLTQSEPRTMKASFFFDMKTKALVNVKWFVRDETEADFAALKKRYPATQLLVNKKTKKLQEVSVVVQAPEKKKTKR